ncbi:uncharacterized protein At4g22758 [Quercus robur]|uniref:uncharacterized protein At4g22758 n=1 Tax=Quercus robur TaxID=38942 RepID=UPI00216302CF|nr:uncharacterized protein At4g22758 [Quercus robur]
MPNSKSHRRVPEEKNRRGKLAHRASSFHGQSHLTMAAELRRPNTTPELLSYNNVVGSTPMEGRPPAARLTKLLLNVTIQGSLGPVQVVMSPELTVGDLVAAAVKIYAKECRRPILPTTDPAMFDLHYSQFSLESLDREEKLMALGSRNFFLCNKRTALDGGVTTSCSTQAEKDSKTGFAWLKFMDFLL